jgi:hypothetical protein
MNPAPPVTMYMYKFSPKGLRLFQLSKNLKPSRSLGFDKRSTGFG